VQQEIETLMTFVNFCLRRLVDDWDIFLLFERDSAAAPASGQPESQPGALVRASSQFQSTGYNRVLLGRRNLGADLSSCLQAWWSTFDKFRPAIAHHLAILGGAIPYLNVRFLNATQGLEAFHRRFQKGVEAIRKAQEA
jgi:ApeA N-terminal domain 1